MLLTETLQRSMEHCHLTELYPADWALSAMACGPQWRTCCFFLNNFNCQSMSADTYSSIELQISKVGRLDSFYCILLYRPAGPVAPFLKNCIDFLWSIIKLNSLIIVGDFNIHVDVTAWNTASEFLYIMQSFNLIQHVSGPTHDKGHTLDLVFMV